MRKQSPLQAVCMQYGKDCFAHSNSHTLAQFLRQNGQPEAAEAVQSAIRLARDIARNNYFTRRKELQPDWKDWTETAHERWDEAIKKIEQGCFDLLTGTEERNE